MDSGQLMIFTSTWQNLLPEGTLVGVQERLKRLPEDKMSMLSAIQLKIPTTGLICSLLGGLISVDRFYKGDIGLGIAKIATLPIGVGFVWVIADLFLVYKGIKIDNLNKVNMMLMQLGV